MSGQSPGNLKPLAVDRQKLHTRWGQLKNERASWFGHWMELSRYLLPYSGRFFIQDRNKGLRRFNNVYDNTPTRALRVLAAGMMSGMTSPARPWFRLSIADNELAKHGPVKVWLAQTTQIMRDIFAKSNTYRSFHQMYEELGVFGTAASIVAPHFGHVIHHHTLTAGEYCIATDWQGNVTTLYREFQKTVGEVVREFGIDNVSTTVKSMYQRGTLDQWVTIIHAIEPRADRDPSNPTSQHMPWGSYCFEAGANADQFLRESGYKNFPAIVPRWAIAGGDIYGNSPGMECLGDARQLQQEQFRKGQVIDYQTLPPLQVPSFLKEREVDMHPGGITYVDMNVPNSTIKSMFDVPLDLNHLLADINDVRDRIRSSFYADLFLMLANQTDARMTATEVAERHEEKLLMLGPVLERLFNEQLEPLIEITFTRMIEAGIVPPPPSELHGMDLDIEFTSMLAQAQQAVGTNSVDRFIVNLGSIAQFKPEVLDKFNADYWAEAYSDMLGIDPQLIVPSDQVALVRQQRAMAQQAAQAAAMAQPANQLASAAHKVSQIDPAQRSEIMNMFSGYTQQ